MLKRVWVPSEEELYHRQVIRRRRQLVRDRVRTQSRIKAELRFYGVHLEEFRGKWTQIYFANLPKTMKKLHNLEEAVISIYEFEEMAGNRDEASRL
jgi:transposase